MVFQVDTRNSHEAVRFVRDCVLSSNVKSLTKHVKHLSDLVDHLYDPCLLTHYDSNMETAWDLISTRLGSPSEKKRSGTRYSKSLIRVLSTRTHWPWYGMVAFLDEFMEEHKSIVHLTSSHVVLNSCKFECPITMCELSTPAFLPCCHRLVEKWAIEKHFSTNELCPFCRRLSSFDIVRLG
jgi:hypothetical protein